MQDGAKLVEMIRERTSVHLELLETEDPRAGVCPPGQRLLRVAGGRDQVGEDTIIPGISNRMYNTWNAVAVFLHCRIFMLPGALLELSLIHI